MKYLFGLFLFASVNVYSADIYNTLRHLYVADQDEPFFEVISLSKSEVIERVAIDFVADDLLVSPSGPVLVYSDISERKVVIYNLRKKETAAEFTLEFDPRHIVLDTTGANIGISDSVNGGFAMISLSQQEIKIQIPDFTKTGDVLFDPNETDVYFSNNAEGSIGILDTNNQSIYQMPLVDVDEDTEVQFSSPSRSLDGRYVYLAEFNSGDVFSLNAYSRIVYQTFNIGRSPSRPYTSPEGIFLYLLDRETGRFQSFQQHNFSTFADTTIGPGIDLVTVGRFDRMNLFASRTNKSWYLFDNTMNRVAAQGEFKGVPIDAQGSVDGKTAFVAFRNIPEVAVIQLEKKKVSYIPATENGAGAFSLATNNVCH